MWIAGSFSLCSSLLFGTCPDAYSSCLHLTTQGVCWALLGIPLPELSPRSSQVSLRNCRAHRLFLVSLGPPSFFVCYLYLENFCFLYFLFS